MKKIQKIVLLLLIIVPVSLFAKKNANAIEFVEYDLVNGLHVILHQNVSAPNVLIGVRYHVGAKNETDNLTGFAHFFEHLLFHGSKNIPQGTFDSFILKAGGYDNAYTNYDFTYYYEFLPAHEYKLGLWMEAERMLHPIITKEGIDIEREVVKEEKRMRYDNKTIGMAYYDLWCNNFQDHPYNHSIIGSMEDLNNATTADFEHFFKTNYVPNNACLVIAGDIDIDETKAEIKKYFKDIPRGADIKRPVYDEVRPEKEVTFERTDHRLKKTHVGMSFLASAESTQDAKIMSLIAMLLSNNGETSLLKTGFTNLEGAASDKASSSSEVYEQAGALFIRANVEKDHTVQEVKDGIDKVLEKLKTEPVDENQLRKLKNKLKSEYIDLNYDMETIADMLSLHHFSYGAASTYNDIIADYMKVTSEDIQRAAKKYLRPENRTVFIYHPTEKETETTK